MKIKQYYPRNVDMPEPGEIRDLVDRTGKVGAVGVVYGVIPKERTALIAVLELNEDGVYNGK